MSRSSNGGHGGHSREQELQQLMAAVKCSLSGQQAQDAQAFIQRVKSLQNGWSYFLELFTRCCEQQQDIAFVCVGNLCDIVKATLVSSTANSSSSSSLSLHLTNNAQTPPPPSHQQTSQISPPIFLQNIRKVVIQWIQANVTQGTLHYQPKFLQTKISLLYILLIKLEYPSTWETPFHFLFNLLQTPGPKPIDTLHLYLTITKVLMDEVVAYDTNRQSFEIQRNMEIKYQMKNQNIYQQFFQIFVHILQRYNNNNNNININSINSSSNNNNSDNGDNEGKQKILVHCLATMTEWIGWVHLSIASSPDILKGIFSCLNHATSYTVRMSACGCIKELVEKNMSSVERIVLLRQLNLISMLKQFSIPCINGRNRAWKINDSEQQQQQQQQQQNTMFSIQNNQETLNYDEQEKEIEFGESLGALINSVAYRLICCRDVLIGVSTEGRTNSNGNENGNGNDWTAELALECDTMIGRAMELVWIYFQHPEIGISEEMISSISALVKTMSREVQNRAPYSSRSQIQFIQFLPIILSSVERQLR
jgi:hypothetical protein